LAAGAAELPESVRSRHTGYLLSAQASDGGFPGREGESDLYYTGFALRSLFMLGALHGPTAERVAEFLRSQGTTRESVMDFLSLVYSVVLLDLAAGIDVFSDSAPHWRDAVAETLEGLRRPDGGYAKAKEGRAGSTYQSFLVVLCLQLIGRPVPEPDRMVEFILSQRADQGGFREIRVAKRAGTNPTAAAIGVLRILDRMDQEVAEDTRAFLVDMQTEEGGFRANTRIPIADLLSTFTGVLTLDDLGGLDQIDQGAVLRYVRSLERHQGGFRGATWDEGADVEYTLYGLACMSLLEAPDARGQESTHV
jgi:geranylgeranyl transferase type-2 subunit beta